MEVHMDSRQSPRRRFLKHAAALGGLSVGAVRSAVGRAGEGVFRRIGLLSYAVQLGEASIFRSR
jgi:hypothetical protein